MTIGDETYLTRWKKLNGMVELEMSDGQLREALVHDLDVQGVVVKVVKPAPSGCTSRGGDMGKLLKVGGLAALATILTILPTWLPSEAKQVWPTPRPVPTLAPAPTRVPARGTVAALPVCGPTTELYLGDPAAYVLSLDDMPTGFYPVVERTSPETNELLISVAPDPEQRRAELEAWGRRGGYAAAFRTNSLLGASYVVNSVGIYETAEGAHQAFWDRDSREIQAGRLPVSMPSYCDEAKAYTWTYQESATSPIWTWYSVNFRKGNVSAGVGVVSRNFGDALQFAGLMQPKIQ